MLKQEKKAKRKASGQKADDNKKEQDQQLDGHSAELDAAATAFNESLMSSSTGSIPTRAADGSDPGCGGNARLTSVIMNAGDGAEAKDSKARKSSKGSTDGARDGGKTKKSEEKQGKKEKGKDKSEKREKRDKEEKSNKVGGFLREFMMKKSGSTIDDRRSRRKKGAISTSISTSDLHTLSQESLTKPLSPISAHHLSTKARSATASNPSPRAGSATPICVSASNLIGEHSSILLQNESTDTDGTAGESGDKPRALGRFRRKTKTSKQPKDSDGEEGLASTTNAFTRPESATRRRSATVAAFGPAMAMEHAMEAFFSTYLAESKSTEQCFLDLRTRDDSPENTDSQVAPSDSTPMQSMESGQEQDTGKLLAGSSPSPSERSSEENAVASKSPFSSPLSSSSISPTLSRKGRRSRKNSKDSSSPLVESADNSPKPKRPTLPSLRVSDLPQSPPKIKREMMLSDYSSLSTSKPRLLSHHQTSISPLLSPRYNHNLNFPSRYRVLMDNRRSQQIDPSAYMYINEEWQEDHKVVFDQAVEDMIHSRWEEYESIRRLRGGIRRSKTKPPPETDAVKLQTDANVFLGAMKEMLKLRTQMVASNYEIGQTTPPRSQRRKEIQMRIKREQKSRAVRSSMRNPLPGEELRLNINQLKSEEDATNLKSATNQSTTSFSIPVPPPPPPVAVSNPLSSHFNSMQEDGKWGCNLLSIEHPVIYEELFTLASSHLENVPGIYRWRIENLAPVWISHLDEQHPINHFYESDCYIVLYVGRMDEEEDIEDSPNKKEGLEKNSILTFNLHYWIGRSASIDKKASVCIRAVQLNSYIGGKAKHYPENQGEESSIFLSYFKKTSRPRSFSGSGSIRTRGSSHTETSISDDVSPLVYLEGGTEAGLRRVHGVEPYDVPRLYRFFMPYSSAQDDEDEDESAEFLAMISGDLVEEKKKKRKKRVYPYFVQLVEPTIKSLNSRDVFLLDTGGYQLFQWNGKRARQRLALACREIVSMINVIERKSLARIEVLTQGNKRTHRRSLFWKYLGFHLNDEAETKTGGQPAEPIIDTPGQVPIENKGALSESSPAVPEPQKKNDAKDVKKVEKYPEDEIVDLNSENEDPESGGIKEVLEVRGEYGSMDLHTVWTQKTLPSDSSGLVDETGLKPSKKLLSSKGVFIIDCISEIFVYSGRKASAYSRQIAAFIANQMKEEDENDIHSNRPSCCVTSDVKEREESVLFKARFLDWLDEESGKWGAREKQAPKDYRAPHERIWDEIRKLGAKQIPMPKVDFARLFPPLGRSGSFPATMTSEDVLPEASTWQITSVDDDLLTETGSVEVGILLSGKTFHKLPQVEMGHFYSGECYVILHTFMDKVKDVRKWVIYFWEGKNASSLRWPTFLLGLYPLLEEKIVRSGGGIIESRRIYQGEEPDEFMRLFRGTIVIRRGQRTPSLEVSMEMFQARIDSSERFTRLVSVECSPKSLSSKEAYGLFLPSGKVFIWAGKHSSRKSSDALVSLIQTATAALNNEQAKQDASSALLQGEGAVVSHADDKGAATRALAQGSTINDGTSISYSYITEGAEPLEFWEALGQDGKLNPDVGNHLAIDIQARLAKFCYDAGHFHASEVQKYSQRDLQEACVYLLHPLLPNQAHAESSAHSGSYLGKLYLWIGRQATEALLIAARYTAHRYALYIAGLTDEGSVKKEEANVLEEPAATGTELKCKIAEIIEVSEGLESQEFKRFFSDWTRKVFVDPYEVRMVERRRLEEQERREMEKKLGEEKGAIQSDIGNHFNEAENALSPKSPTLTDDPTGLTEAQLAEQKRKKMEREEFLRKLREDRIRQEERQKQREKKEEEERRRRRQKQELLRAKLKMLEQEVNDYYLTDTHAGGTVATAASAAAQPGQPDSSPPKDAGTKRRDSMRAIGGLIFGKSNRSTRAATMTRTESLPSIARASFKNKKDTKLEKAGSPPPTKASQEKEKEQQAQQRLQERQEELLSRLKTRSRFLAYEPSRLPAGRVTPISGLASAGEQSPPPAPSTTVV